MPQKEVKTLIYEIVWDDGNASKKADNWNEKLEKSAEEAEKMSSSFVSLGGTLNAFSAVMSTTGKTLDLAVDGFSAIVNNSVELQDAMNGVKRTADLSTESIGELTGKVRDYSVNVLQGFGSSEQLAEALEIAGQQGIFAGKSLEQGSEDALVFASTMVKAAVALDGLNLQSASERLGLFHGTFTDVIPTIENAASVLNYFGNTTKRGADFILNLSGRLAESANYVGLSEGATLALAASLGNLNQAASRSGSSMSRIMRLMRSDTSKFAEVFKLNAEEFSSLVKNDMEAAIIMLAEQMQRLSKDEVLQGLKDMHLSGDAVATTMLGLGNLTETLIKHFGEYNKVWSENTSLTDEFINSSERVSSLWRAIQEIFWNFVGLIGDKMLPYIAEFLEYVQQGAIELYNWAKSGDFLTKTLPKAFREITDALKGIVANAAEAARNIDWAQVLKRTEGLAKGIMNFLTDTLPDIVDLLIGVGEKWEGLVDIIELFASIIRPVINFLRDFTMPTFQGIVDLIVAMTDGTSNLGDMFKIVFEAIGNQVNKGIEAITKLANKFWDLVLPIKEADKEAVGESLFPDIVEWAGIATKSIDSMNTALINTSAAIANAGNGLQSFGGFAGQQTTLQSFGGFAGQQTILQSFGGTARQQIASQNYNNQMQATAQPVTIIIEGSETAKLAGVIRSENRDYASRTVQNLSSLSSFGAA